ncbi:hypothetical protein FA13DRAFT_1808442 [Coprinellus micaceus]|uniref:Uncharacterized protein n=1 Tax=Coprinellus micaceus TaxID=71717 RepID=A0A4Y7U1S3_COPMI|nr:hypothetical protein FA13DRAFT_1808442 [Coprinellus micaceus]
MDNSPPLANHPSTATITTTNLHEAVSMCEGIEDLERTEPEHRVKLGSSKTVFFTVSAPSSGDPWGNISHGSPNLENTSQADGGVSWPHGAIDTNLCAGSSCRFANPIFSTILKGAHGSWDSVTLNCSTPSCLRNLITLLQEDQPDLGSDSAWNSVKTFTLVAASWTRWVGPPHRRSLQDLTFIPTSVTSLSIRLPIMTPELQLWDRPLHIQPTLLQGLTSLEVVSGASFTERDVEAFVIFSALQPAKNLKL